MPRTIDTSHITNFEDVVHDLLEQKGSKFIQTAVMETSKGDKHMFDRLGSFTASEIVEATQATVLQDAAHSRRMATVRLYAASTSLADLDMIKRMTDPTHDYTRKLARAHGRNFDTVFLAALLGTASTGKDGDGTAAFDTSNNQIAHGSAGFTLAKFNQALRIMEGDDVDIDGTKLYLGIGARAVEDLMAESSVISIDFQNSKALADGNLPQLRGVNIIRAQNIPHETADTTYRGVLYTEDCMRVAMPKRIETEMGKDYTKNGLPVIITKSAVGAVRMEEKLVVDVLYQ